MLIHTSERWPGVVTIHLWPYAMRMVNQAYNATPLLSHTGKQSPNKIFNNSAVDINQKHWKPFGCPVYVLKAELQGTTRIHPKWDARSRAGIYMGQSLVHNRNVALVLNIHTGYVSPQFHVKFNETFRTLQQDKWNATWLISTGFMTQINKVSPNEAITPSGKRRKTQEQQFPNEEIRDHPGKRQKVAVTANGFHYRSVIGKLDYLEKAMRPDISFATHQCARFAAAPKKSHSHAVRWLGRYLLHTKKKGMRFRADITCGLEVFVDTSFAGNWDKKDTQTGDHDTARSRHGYIILYYGCPLIWKSQLQTEIALSSTESKYTGLSYALCEAIPLLSLLDELKEQGFPVDKTKAMI